MSGKASVRGKIEQAVSGVAYNASRTVSGMGGFGIVSHFPHRGQSLMIVIYVDMSPLWQGTRVKRLG